MARMADGLSEAGERPEPAVKHQTPHIPRRPGSRRVCCNRRFLEDDDRVSVTLGERAPVGCAGSPRVTAPRADRHAGALEGVRRIIRCFSRSLSGIAG